MANNSRRMCVENTSRYTVLTRFATTTRLIARPVTDLARRPERSRDRRAASFDASGPVRRAALRAAGGRIRSGSQVQSNSAELAIPIGSGLLDPAEGGVSPDAPNVRVVLLSVLRLSASSARDRS